MPSSCHSWLLRNRPTIRRSTYWGKARQQCVPASLEEHPEDETFPGLLLLRVEGRVFFVNAERIADKIRPLVEEAKPKVVALDFSAVPDLEYTALKMLTQGEKRQRERGVALWLVDSTRTCCHGAEVIAG